MWINFLDSYKNQSCFIQRASAFQILKLLAYISRIIHEFASNFICKITTSLQFLDAISSRYDQLHTNQHKKTEDSIKEIITKSGNEYSIDMAFYNSQRNSISERCSLYNSMEGQRTDLIENQCEYDGVEQLNDFIKTYVKTVDNY